MSSSYPSARDRGHVVGGKTISFLRTPLEEMEDALVPSPLVKEIHLCRNDLSVLPPLVCQFHSLTHLTVKSNPIRCIPEEVCHLAQLRFLILSQNLLESLPESIGTLAHLVLLDVSANAIKELPPTIGELSNLKHLVLAENHLSSLPLQIGNLENLVSLCAKSNRLRSLPSTIGSLWNLEELALSHNRLESIPPAALAGLRSLKTLDISDNRIRRLPTSMCRMSRLELLNANTNALRTLPSELSSLTNLSHLYIAKNALEHLPREVLRMAQLKHLALQFNPDLRYPPLEVVSKNSRSASAQADAVKDYMGKNADVHSMKGRWMMLWPVIRVLLASHQKGDYSGGGSPFSMLPLEIFLRIERFVLYCPYVPYAPRPRGDGRASCLVTCAPLPHGGEGAHPSRMRPPSRTATASDDAARAFVPLRRASPTTTLPAPPPVARGAMHPRVSSFTHQRSIRAQLGGTYLIH